MQPPGTTQLGGAVRAPRYDLDSMMGELQRRLVSLAQGVGAEMWGPREQDAKLRIAFTRDGQSAIVEIPSDATADQVVKVCSKKLKAWPAK